MNYEDRVTKAAVEAAIEGSIVFGTYTGDGTGTRTINLGFTPRLVFLEAANGGTFMTDLSGGYNYYCGGLISQEHSIIDAYNRTVAEIVGGGFEVHQHVYENGYNVHNANSISYTYYYVALK